MPQKVLIIDTSILCVYLQVPGKATCGPDEDKWDYELVKLKFEEEQKLKTLFVLPMTTLIECGNHIGHIDGGGCHKFASALAEVIKDAVNEKSPWAAFTDQGSLWGSEELLDLVEDWPIRCSSIGIGDYMIVDVAEYYSKMGNSVELLTGDQGLKAYEPARPVLKPRRRK